MSKDIINVPALLRAVDEALKGTPAVLRGYGPGLRAFFRRVATEHASVRRARRRQDDPAWAQAKFKAGARLDRFHEAERGELIEWIQQHLVSLREVADLAGDPKVPGRHQAAEFLRQLPHCRDGVEDLKHRARGLLHEAKRAALRADLRARRAEVMRAPAEVEVGGFVARRCVSIEEITRLGRKARNCLAQSECYWARFASGEADVWALHCGDRLVAVLEAQSRTKCVTEAQGPGNTTIALRDVQGVARVCEALGLIIGPNCDGLLPDFAAPLLLGPWAVEIDRRVAVYAEWPTAVRIDLGPEPHWHWLRQEAASTLALSFDRDRPLAAAMVEGQDLGQAVKSFGRKRLRRVLRAVALDQTTPTLVQHRLLALAT